MFSRVRHHAPLVSLLAVVGLLLALANTDRLPTLAKTAPLTPKTAVLEQLPEMDGVSYEQETLYLFAGENPLMTVRMGTNPAELYGADGRFAGFLDRQELARIIGTTRQWVTHRQPPEDGPDYTGRVTFPL